MMKDPLRLTFGAREGPLPCSKCETRCWRRKKEGRWNCRKTNNVPRTPLRVRVLFGEGERELSIWGRVEGSTRLTLNQCGTKLDVDLRKFSRKCHMLVPQFKCSNTADSSTRATLSPVLFIVTLSVLLRRYSVFLSFLHSSRLQMLIISFTQYAGSHINLSAIQAYALYVASATHGFFFDFFNFNTAGFSSRSPSAHPSAAHSQYPLHHSLWCRRLVQFHCSTHPSDRDPLLALPVSDCRTSLILPECVFISLCPCLAYC
jgi:hypothetical protein